jgi:hypothetical protein
MMVDGGYIIAPNRNNVIEANSGALTFFNSATVTNLENQISNLRSALNTAGHSDIPIAITEANICHSNDIDNTAEFSNSANANLNTTPGANDLLTGNGANSFIAGQFWAEILNVAMKKDIEFVNFWSVIEGDSVYDAVNDPAENHKRTNAGFIDYRGSTGYKKKSSYYHFQMVAENFRDSLLDVSDNRDSVKAFASLSPWNGISVMLMNQEIGNTMSYTVDLNSSASTSTLRVDVDAGIAKSYTSTIEGESTQLLLFDLAGNLKRKCIYELNGNADSNLPPTCTDYCIDSSDAYLADFPGYDGYEPNTIYPYWLTFSEDMWVRNDAPTLTSVTTDPPMYANEFQHQNPIWVNDTADAPWVYAKVRNRGCDSIHGRLHLYYSRASLGDKWSTTPTGPGRRRGWVEIASGPSPGDTLGIQVDLAADEEGTYTARWDSIAYQTDPGGSSFEFCLLARFESAGDPMYTELNDTAAGWNAQLNNNIIQKNVTVVDTSTTDSICVYVTNMQPIEATAKIQFFASEMGCNTFFDAGGHVSVDLGQDLWDIWDDGGQVNDGVKSMPGSTVIELTKSDAYIDNLVLDAQMQTQICFDFTYEVGTPGIKYNFDAREFVDGVFTGAERYIITYPDCPQVQTIDDSRIDLGCGIKLKTNPDLKDASWTWIIYECKGDSSSVGDTISILAEPDVKPDFTTTYQVFLKQSNGCFSTDFVTITVTEDTCVERKPVVQNQLMNEAQRLDCIPNPASNSALFIYSAQENASSEIRVYNMMGQEMSRYKLEKNSSSVRADYSEYQNGIYFYSLLVNGKKVQTKKLVITK